MSIHQQPLVLAIAICLAVPTGLAIPAIAADPVSPVLIQVNELRFLVGSWEGYLEYLDYGDGETRVQLPTTVQYEPTEKSINFVTTFTEPNGSKVKDKGSIRPSRAKHQLMFDGARNRVLAKQFDQDAETFKIVMQRPGKDNNRSATMTTTILRRKGELEITKRVQYEGEDESFVRNKYSFKRVD